MDENKLAGLFQDATHNAPPASFDVSDIRSASRRATMRRRNAIAAGSTLVVVLGFGGVVASAGWLGQEKAAFNSAEDAGQAADNSAQSPLSAPAVPTRDQNFPGDVSTQGDASKPGSPDPRVGGSAVQGCAVVDRELADALAGELSVSTEFAEPPTVTCSPKSRSAMFKVGGLTVTAIVTPDAFKAPAGAAKVKTAKGQDLYVFTQGDGELKGQAKRFADALAPKF